MHKNRLEAFTDGVLAIVITIMVLEIKVPHGDTLQALLPLWPKLLSYALSFIYVGIYWNNHHHTMQVVKSVNGTILWTNTHLLFWLSLLPFSTGWMGENHFATLPTILYGINLLLCAIAYFIWAHSLINHHGEKSVLAEAFGNDLKGKISIVLYCLGIGFSLVNHWLGFAIYSLVALIWLVPDKRMAKVLS
ncbi:MAG TPA: TMEM175 family protein [Agitococcus sp.]|nr:TMEM175 family protein [Agitococcus sp.]